MTKRIFDLVLGSTALVVSAPLWLLCVIVIRLQSPGPILYVQQRIGQGGEIFRLSKFRTMHVGAETQLTNTVTVADDERVFRGGRFMRRHKLDELPQLLNVLDGTMSLVGPRPTTAEDVERMTERQERRHDVKPGMTGLAQVNGNTSLTWPERIEYDLEYVEHSGLVDDVRILVRTTRLLLTAKAHTDVEGVDEWGSG